MTWRFVGASTVGMRPPCQDAHFHIQTKNHIVAAVADGLGSAKHSAKGSRVAVRSACRKLAKLLTSELHCDSKPPSESSLCELLRTTFDHTHQQLAKMARRAGEPIDNFGTTLAVALCSSTGFSAVGQVGDGFVVVEQAGRVFSPLSLARLDLEYVNLTYTITDPEHFKHSSFWASSDPLAAIAMASDGIEPAAMCFKSRNIYTPFFTTLFNYLGEKRPPEEQQQTLESFLGGPRLAAISDDDKTLAVITKG